ncbi:MAG: TlpA disulfide reductase family protein [Planctomycetota bacterium]
MTHRLRRVGPLVILATSTVLALTPQLSAGPKEELSKLEDEMEAAFETHVKTVEARAKERSQRGGVREDDAPRTSPDGPAGTADPRLDVLMKMDALADATIAASDGALISRKTFVWSGAYRLDPAKLFLRFDRIVKHHAFDPDLEEVLLLAPEVYRLAGEPKQWTDGLRRIADQAKKPPVKLRAIAAAGQVWLNAGLLGEARPFFSEAVDLDPDGELGALARGYVHEIDHLQVGMAAPDFTTKTLDGKTVSLKSLRGKVVLLDFWATWCASCLTETPTLRAAAKKFKDQPFEVVGLSLDEVRELLAATVQQQQMPGLQTWEPSGRDNPVATLYNAQILPTWYLIDAEGIIRERDPLGEKLIPAIEKLLRTE